METLDRVYTTFKNLDRDYARSKKTRTEFITDKFGGDIDIGSMIILDAISSSTGEETPEDIQKLTFVKDIFAKIKENRNDLDSLPDFSFTNNTVFGNFMQLVADSVAAGTHIRKETQARIRRMDKGAMHFISDADGSVYAPLDSCKVLHIYNEHMQGVANITARNAVNVTLGGYVDVRNRMHYVAIDEAKAIKTIK